MKMQILSFRVVLKCDTIYKGIISVICLSSLGLLKHTNQLVFIIFSYNFSRLYNASVNVSRTVKYSPITRRPHPRQQQSNSNTKTYITHFCRI